MSASAGKGTWRIGRLPARLCVMLSGSGRTLMNLIDATRDARLSAEIALVIASRECLGAERARTAGVTTVVIRGDIEADELGRVLDEHTIDVVALGGYLRKLSIPPAYRGRIVNIHPALLPKFGGAGMYGDRVHAAVLSAGEQESGCSVHLVTDEYDEGPVLAQERCTVEAGDDVRRLAARVFELECATYPEALESFIRTHLQRHD